MKLDAEQAEGWIERVRRKTRLVTLVDTKLVTHDGTLYVGPCPFCGSGDKRKPKFFVNRPRMFYHCAACKAGGDCFKYIQDTMGLSFLEAVQFLSDAAGLNAPQTLKDDR